MYVHVLYMYMYVRTCACGCMYMYMYVECVFSEIVCSALCFHDFVCMNLLFFDDFLKFPKLKQPFRSQKCAFLSTF